MGILILGNELLGLRSQFYPAHTHGLPTWCRRRITGSSKPCRVAMTASSETLTARRSRSWGIAGTLSLEQR
jgi:hypothetical protein